MAPAGSLKIQPVNFESFQMAMALSTKAVLSTFAPEKRVFLNLATHIAPVCDCFGMTPIAILPDVGLFGGDDICAVDQATLDALKELRLIAEHIPESYEVQYDLPHPLQQLHGRFKDPYLVVKYGEQLGLGSCAYELIDVMAETAATGELGAVSAAGL